MLSLINGNAVIFLGQFTLSLLLYWVLAKFYAWPKLSRLPTESALALLLIPHAFRHLGFLVMVPMVVDPELTKTFFAASLAYGDLVAMPLALVAIIGLNLRWRSGKALAWIFSLFGALDLLSALFQALRLPVYNYQLTTFWTVCTFVVPALLVAHFMIFVLLFRKSLAQTSVQNT